MKVDHRVLSYEMNQHLSKPSQNISEGALEKSALNEPNIGGNAQTTHQDTVVHLSQAAREDVRLIQETIASEPDIREDLVARLKEKIESGRYDIDHAAVAEKILGTLEEDLS